MTRHLALLLFVAVPAVASAQIGPVPVPAGNPITLDKTNLGKVLFWDEQLSTTNNVACGTCHLPEFGGSDPRSLRGGAVHPGPDGSFGSADDISGSPGVVRHLTGGGYQSDAAFGLAPQVTSRKSPSMINAAFAPLLFWDGRAEDTFVDPTSGAVLLPSNAALETQSIQPLLSDVEMAHTGRTFTEVETRLASLMPLALASDIPPALDAWIAGRSYPELFQATFGSPGITIARIGLALATYQRTLISDQSPFDLFLAGVPNALTPQQELGRDLFNGQGRCDFCHDGVLQTDQEFHNIGLRPPGEDVGRMDVTGQNSDRGRFKTPSLRNVELRAPFFHNGSAATLDELVAFYNRGGDFDENQDFRIRPLGLNGTERAAIVAFLRSLTDPRVAAGAPPFERPTLFSESARASSPVGAPSPGAGGFSPRMVADEPVMLGNPALTFGIEGALGGGTAFLLLDTSPNPPGASFGGVVLHLGLTPELRLEATVPLSGSGPGRGWGSYTVPIGPNVAFAGSSVYLQWVVFQPGLSSLAASSAVEVHVF